MGVVEGGVAVQFADEFGDVEAPADDEDAVGVVGLLLQEVVEEEVLGFALAVGDDLGRTNLLGELQGFEFGPESSAGEFAAGTGEEEVELSHGGTGMDEFGLYDTGDGVCCKCLGS